MEIFISDTYQAMSLKACKDVIQLLPLDKSPLLCTASGESPVGLYEEFVRQYTNERLDPYDWYFVALDEWLGMNGDDEGSCRFHLDRQLFGPLGIKEDQIGFFDGRANPEIECKRIESFIVEHGGIDVAIIGLGMNGHVGMNEPGTSATLRAHVTPIDKITQQAAQRYFKETKEVTHGITVGIADLMDASHIILLVSGEKKADITKQVLEGEISEQLPASLLRKHPGFRVYLDIAAAKKLKVQGQ